MGRIMKPNSSTAYPLWDSSQRLKTTIVLIYMVLIIGALFSICESARSPGDKPDRECNSIGNQLKSKGFTYPWWDPKSTASVSTTTPTTSLASGCPATGKSLKCCSASFDTSIERRQMTTAFSQKWLGSKLNFVSDIFKDKKRRFDTTFKSLLQRAHTSFHAMFERTYGMLYIQHAHVFHALFTTLEKYYDDGRDPLESKLNEFFAILTRKMFEVLNAQYDFTESYLSCATIVISEKQGNDLHRQIVSSLRRSFVATRALSQALQDADRVVHNMQKVELSPSECLVPLSQMLHCPICSEQRAYKPCLKLCTGVTSKCLSGTSAIVKPWAEFTKAVEDIIDRLLGPYNVEAVVEPIHIKISEAIMNFQESGSDLSMAVFSKCGKPTLKSRTRKRRDASPSPPIAQASTSGRNSNSNNGKDDDSQNNKSLEKLLRETKSKIRKAKDVWSALPRQVCNAISKDYSSQLCWNGTMILRSNKTKSNNREEDDHTDVSSLGRPGGSPGSVVLEQILIIQLITDKLKTAYNGGDVQWVKEDDDDDEIGSGMGSGSGESPTDLEDTDDDDPAGMITHSNTNTHPVITPEWKPNTPTNNNPVFTIDNEKGNRPSFPGSTPIETGSTSSHPDSDDEEDDIDEDEDEEDDNISNLNIDSTNRNNNNRANINSNSELDFGGSFTPPSPPRVPVPAPPFPYPTTTTTSTMPTTTRRTTTTTTTQPPPRSGTKGTSSKTPAPGSLDDTAGKTVAVVKLFTPVIASMLQKLFTFN